MRLDTVKARAGPATFDWLPVVVGLLALYVPTFYGLSSGFWQQEEGAHGPIIALVIGWLFWQKRSLLLAPSPPEPAPKAGFVLLIIGLLLYVLGRSQEIAFFEICALAPILAGTLLAMRGWTALRACWFPILFIAFLIPLPNIFVDALTGPLKQQVSEIAAQLLYLAGYPVARNGVMLTIGQYQLLVADACSGLHSMFSLSALGLLFMNLSARASVLHNVLMLASILPIAFFANVVRVLLLILITYHFGDAAGQGFLHGATGIVLLLAALSILIGLDSVLSRLISKSRAR